MFLGVDGAEMRGRSMRPWTPRAVLWCRGLAVNSKSWWAAKSTVYCLVLGVGEEWKVFQARCIEAKRLFQNCLWVWHIFMTGPSQSLHTRARSEHPATDDLASRGRGHCLHGLCVRADQCGCGRCAAAIPFASR